MEPIHHLQQNESIKIKKFGYSGLPHPQNSGGIYRTSSLRRTRRRIIVEERTESVLSDSDSRFSVLLVEAGVYIADSEYVPLSLSRSVLH